MVMANRVLWFSWQQPLQSDLERLSNRESHVDVGRLGMQFSRLLRVAASRSALAFHDDERAKVPNVHALAGDDGSLDFPKKQVHDFSNVSFGPSGDLAETLD